MHVSLSKIVKEAFEVQSTGFVKLVEEATQVLKTEKGEAGTLLILGRLVKVKPSGQAIVVGDIHGDLESLIQVLQESHSLQRMERAKNLILIFLGDYGDRGPYSAEVYYTILKLKLHFPEQVVLMRGNHEGPEDLMASPHDLPTQFQARFSEKSNGVYAKTRRLFDNLYNAVEVERRYLMIHGGIPQHLRAIEDLAWAHTSHPRETLLEEMLWSDPYEAVDEVLPSPRGAGKAFGKNLTSEVLTKLNVKVLIRGHEPCEEGFKIDHDGKVLTLFSRKGPPYFNSHGAYMDVELSKRFASAEQLIPYIHKF